MSVKWKSSRAEPSPDAAGPDLLGSFLLAAGGRVRKVRVYVVVYQQTSSAGVRPVPVRVLRPAEWRTDPIHLSGV